MSPHNARHVVGSTLRAKLYVHSLIPGCTVRCLSCCDYYISSHDVLFSGARVRRLATHPTEQSWVVSAVQGNNEVTVWDLETGARRQALWASHTPPLSQTQVCYRKLLLIRSGLLQLTKGLITGLEKVLRNNLLRLWAPAAGAHKRSEQLPY